MNGPGIEHVRLKNNSRIAAKQCCLARGIQTKRKSVETPCHRKSRPIVQHLVRDINRFACGPARPEGCTFMTLDRLNVKPHIDLVRSQINWLKGQIERYDRRHPRFRQDLVEMYVELLDRHESLLIFLESLVSDPESKNQPPEIPKSETIAPSSEVSHRPLTPELSDLPAELLKELSESAVRGEIDPIVQIIVDRGGSANLDEILIDLYRKHGEIGKRIIMANRMYRLAKKGLVHVMPGKKVIYTTNLPNEAKSALSGLAS